MASDHYAESERLIGLAESESWYGEDGRLARVTTILAAAQVHATLAMLADAREAGKREGAAEVRARVEALAETWRYKGEFGWGPWQIGEGPDLEGQVLDHAASQLRAALTDPEGTP